MTRKRRRRIVRMGPTGPKLIPPDNSKTYTFKQRELMTMLINRASQQLCIDAPFTHSVTFLKANPRDPDADLIIVKLEPTANIIQFPGKKR